MCHSERSEESKISRFARNEKKKNIYNNAMIKVGIIKLKG